MAYSGVADLQHGDLTIPASINLQRFIDSAAEEMDSRLGFVYELPLLENLLERHSWLLLKRISANLSSGRLILELASSAERPSLHAYGKYLVDLAWQELALILDGTLPLEGADPIGEITTTGPMITNLDEESAVESYYDRAPSFAGIWRPGS